LMAAVRRRGPSPSRPRRMVGLEARSASLTQARACPWGGAEVGGGQGPSRDDPPGSLGLREHSIGAEWWCAPKEDPTLGP